MLNKEIDFEFENSGGTINFSTDLDATLIKAQTFIVMVKFFFNSKWRAFLNGINVRGRIKNILADKFIKSEYSLRRNLLSVYTSKNGVIMYKKKSYTMAIDGLDSDVLILIATEICKEFKQEIVMVRDFNKNKVYFVNDKEYIKNDG